MKVAQLVTYVSEDGAFGGPLSVARAQSMELARRGHVVHLIAGWDRRLQLEIPGVDVILFDARKLAPVGGFASMASSTMRAYLKTHLADYDIVHVHLGRDLVSLPAAILARRSKVPYLVQTHGMVMPDRRARTRVLDALATRRVLRGAGAVLTLTPEETNGIRRVLASGGRIESVSNGIELPPVTRQEDNLAAPEVVFMARLHPRKRVLLFAEAARRLIGAGVQARFTVIGPDEGDLPALQSFIRRYDLGQALRYEGALPPGTAPSRLARASIYVLPSIGEVAPMSVLESLSVGTPVIITSDCGLAPTIASSGAGLVVDESEFALRHAIESLLLDAHLRREIGQRGRELAKTTFSLESVARHLEEIYQSVRPDSANMPAHKRSLAD